MISIFFACVSLYAIDTEVSENGVDDANCSPCKTVGYAANKVFGTGAAAGNVSLTLAGGHYEENSEVRINGSLKIAGQNPAECFLSKQNNGEFVLFRVVQVGSNLSFVNLTIWLTNHSLENNIVLGNKEASIIFIECKITQKEGLESIFGGSFDLVEDLKLFWLDKCSVYGITTTSWNDPFSGNWVSNVWITDTTFSRIKATYAVFSLTGSIDGSFNFTGCVSIDCKNVISNISPRYSEKSVIESCSFFNTTGSAIYVVIVNDNVEARNFSISNVSVALGGFFGIMINGPLNVRVVCCSFVRMTDARTSDTTAVALAVSRSGKGSTYVHRCRFENCQYRRGTMSVTNSNVQIIESVFIGNKITGGAVNDIYTNGTSNVTLVDVYTDQSLGKMFELNANGVGALDLCEREYPPTNRVTPFFITVFMDICKGVDTSPRTNAAPLDGKANSGFSPAAIIIIAVLAVVVVVAGVAVVVLVLRGRKKRDQEHEAQGQTVLME